MTNLPTHRSRLTSHRVFALPAPLAAAAITLCLIIGARIVEVLSLPLPRCTFRTLTGLPCLSCGTTRCLTALSHFDLPRAFHFNPLATCIALALFASPLSLLFHGSVHLGARGMKCGTAIGLAAVMANWAYLVLNRI